MEKLLFIEPNKEHESIAIDFIKEMIEYSSSFDGSNDLNLYLENYDEWLNFLEDDKNNPRDNRVHARTFFLIRENDNKLLGMINIRLELNDYLYNIGGHIGYSVRPTERRKGYNTYQLYKGLEFCKSIGLDKVLITCNKDNIGSKKTILNSYGVLNNKVYLEDENIYIERYWIDVKETLEKNRHIKTLVR